MSGFGLKRLARNVVATLGRQLVAGIIQLVTVVIIARVFGPELNGQFTIALLLPMVLATFLNLGIGSANVYHIGAGKVSLSNALRTNIKLWLMLGALGTLLGAVSIYCGAMELFPGVDEQLLWWSLAIYPVTLCLGYLCSMFQGMQRFREFNIILLTQPLVTLLLVVFVSIAAINEIEYVIVAYIAGIIAAIMLSIYYLAVCEFPEKQISNEISYCSSAINYGYKSNLSNILAYLNYKADIFLINYLVGTSAAGIYVVAVQLVERLWLLSQSVSAILLPRLSQLSSDDEKRKIITPIICRWVVALTLIGSIILAAISFPLIKFLFGKVYLDAVTPLLFLLPGILAGSGARILANDIAARGRPELNMYTSWAVVIINITGNILLIPAYGLTGAAIATSLAYLVNLILRLAIYSHLTGVKWSDPLFVKANDIRMMLQVKK